MYIWKVLTGGPAALPAGAIPPVVVRKIALLAHTAVMCAGALGKIVLVP